MHLVRVFVLWWVCLLLAMWGRCGGVACWGVTGLRGHVHMPLIDTQCGRMRTHTHALPPFAPPLACCLSTPRSHLEAQLLPLLGHDLSQLVDAELLRELVEHAELALGGGVVDGDLDAAHWQWEGGRVGSGGEAGGRAGVEAGG